MTEIDVPLTAGGASCSELIVKAACPSGFAGGHGYAAETGKEAEDDG